MSEDTQRCDSGCDDFAKMDGPVVGSIFLRKVDGGHWGEGLHHCTLGSTVLCLVVLYVLFSFLAMLDSAGLTVGQVIFVHLYVKSMAEFATVNSVYKSLFDVNPPMRICVEVDLPENQALLLNCLACRVPADWEKNVMHVQSVSHWAPANIGPYSQAVQLDSIVYVAGQIGLVPGSMVLVEGGVVPQARLCLRHTDRILRAHFEGRGGLGLSHIVQAWCFVTDSRYIRKMDEEWQKGRSMNGSSFPSCRPIYVVVPKLPREALIELHSVASLHAEDFIEGSGSWRLGSMMFKGQWLWHESSKRGSLTFSVELSESVRWTDLRDPFRRHLLACLHQLGTDLSHIVHSTVFYSRRIIDQGLTSGQLQNELDKTFSDAETTKLCWGIVPADALETKQTALTLSCWLQN
eukprot:m.65481 g.65481  ORF g.65481 m.65481 type:complete len:405 (+) comp35320_c0_seq1:1181-2395(+)